MNPNHQPDRLSTDITPQADVTLPIREHSRTDQRTYSIPSNRFIAAPRLHHDPMLCGRVFVIANGDHTRPGGLTAVSYPGLKITAAGVGVVDESGELKVYSVPVELIRPQVGIKDLNSNDHSSTDQGVKPRVVYVSEAEYHEFYVEYCNNAIWHAAHHNNHLVHAPGLFNGVAQQVILNVAEQALALAQSNDLLICDDYHWRTASSLVRQFWNKERGEVPALMYYSHIPESTHQELRAIEMNDADGTPFKLAGVWQHRFTKNYVENTIANDLVGFQRIQDCLNFLESAQQEGFEVDLRKGLVFVPEADGRVRNVRVAAFPVSIEAADYEEMAQSQGAIKSVIDKRAGYAELPVISSIHRCDFSKNWETKIEAVRHLCLKHPELIGKFKIELVAAGTRHGVDGYAELARSVDGWVARVNDAFRILGDDGHVVWEPIALYNEFLREEVAAAYGMKNTVASLMVSSWEGRGLPPDEYFAAQGDCGSGVPIIGRNAGSYDSYADGACVPVENVLDPEQIANAFYEVLTMGTEEREARFRLGRDRLLQYSAADFADARMEAAVFSRCNRYTDPTLLDVSPYDYLPPYMKTRHILHGEMYAPSVPTLGAWVDEA